MTRLQRDMVEFRVTRMRAEATRSGKSVPSREECRALITATGMRCPACGKAMILYAPGMVGLNDVVSLQHRRDGTHTVLCHHCNNREQAHPDDSLVYAVPPDHKWCPGCKTIKPKDQFYKDGRTGAAAGDCVPCHNVRTEANYQRRKQHARERHPS